MLQEKILKLRKRILHSIPILNKDNKRFLFNNRSILLHNLRYLSSGIPLACIAVLLLILGISFNPISAESSFALDGEVKSLDDNEDGKEDKSDTIVGELEEPNETVKAELPESSSHPPLSSSAEVMGVDESDGDKDDGNSEEDYGINTLADDPVLSLSVTNPTLSTTANPGQTSYISSNVTYSASNITQYQLQVSYASGYSSLKRDGGSETLAGAGGKTGSSMSDNTWGFGWGSTSSSNESLTYYTVPAFGTLGSSISNGKLEGTTTTSVASTTKKIVFAAKFASNNANSGHYKTKVLLALTAPPKAVTDPSEVNPLNITTMQEMAPEICSGMPYWENNMKAQKFTPTLTDARDNSTYAITKLDDGRCWMIQNLRLINKGISSADSDVTSNYMVPESLDSSSLNSGAWGVDNTQQLAYYEGSPSYGAWYSWCTATAGTCSSTMVNEAEASGSICPLGWRLPTNQEYKDLLIAAGISGSAGVTKIKGSPYNFKLAGYADSRGIWQEGNYGYYWSRTGYNSEQAYRLDFGSGVKTSTTVRYYGYSVRCIAKQAGE